MLAEVPGVWEPPPELPDGLAEPLLVLLPEVADPGPAPITTLDANSPACFLLIDALGPSRRT